MSYAHRFIAPLLFLIVGIDCGSDAKKARPTTPSLPPTLSDALSLTEVRDDGTRLKVPKNGITEIDVNSKIEIHIEASNLQAIAARVHKPAVPPDVQKTIKILVNITDAEIEFLTKIHDIITTPINKLRLDAINSLTLDSRASLADELEILGLSGDEMRTAEGARKVDRFREETLAQAERGDGVLLRLQAALTHEDRSTSVHLENYDNLEPGPFSIINKFASQITSRELGSQFEQASRLASKLQNLRGARKFVVEAMSQMARALVEELRSTVLNFSEKFAELAPKIAVDALAAVPSAIALRGQVDDVSRHINAIAAECRTLIDSSQMQDVEISRILSCVDVLSGKLPLLISSTNQAVTLIGRLRADAEAQTATKEVKEAFAKLASKLEIVKTFKTKLSAGEQKFQVIIAAMGLGRQGLDVTFTNDQQTDRLIGQAVDTAIELVRTNRKDGDILYFRPSLMLGEKELLIGDSRLMKIVRNGAHLDVSASVIFLDKTGDDHYSFTATPAIVAALHYRSQRNGDKPQGCTVWNAINPGIGLHFAYPDLGQDTMGSQGEPGKTDPTLELSVGVTAVAFGDLLQIGTGYNIFTNDWYWYLGFGLKSLANLGITLNLPGG